MTAQSDKVIYETGNDSLKITVHCTADKLKLFLTAALRQPAMVEGQTLGELLTPLNLPQVEDGVLDDVARALSEGKSCERRRIAKGVAPQPGRDGRVVFLVKKLLAPLGTARSSARRELSSSHDFDNIEAGDIVARVYPPQDGTPGCDVFGTPLRAAVGKPVTLRVDSTLEVVPPDAGKPFGTVVAKLSGYLTEDRGIHLIRSELVVPDDVGPRTGSVRFVGAVKVRGSVNKAYSVIARGDIEISGDVQHGTIVSERGSVIVKGSIVGEVLVQLNAPAVQTVSGTIHRHQPAMVRAKGSVTAFLVQGVEIDAEEDIVIEREASNCCLRTRASLLMPQGHLYGCDVHAVCGVDAKIIGTPSGSITEIHLCGGVESTKEFIEIADRIAAHDTAEEMLLLHLGPYAEGIASLHRLKEDHQRRLRELRTKLAHVRKSRNELLAKREVLRSSSQWNSVLRVNYRESLYPGTVIAVDEHRYRPSRFLIGPETVEFLRETGEFSVTDLKPLQCDADCS